MLPQRTLEYLLYLALFCLLLWLVDAGSLRVENATLATPILTAIPATPTKHEEIRRTFAECDAQLTWLCLKIRLVKLLERLTEHEEFSLMTGISVVRVADARQPKTTEMVADVARSYPNNPNLRLNGLIYAKLEQFLRTHYLRVKLLDAASATEASTTLVETGRKHGHKHGHKHGKKHGHGHGMETVMAAAVMMKATMVVMAGAAVAMLAGKALTTAIMALAMSGVMSMKHSHGGDHKSTTYEIVAKPVYTASHSQSVQDDLGSGHTATGYGGSFARSLRSLEMPRRQQSRSTTSRGQTDF